MTRSRWVVVAAVAGCGDNAVAPIDAASDAIAAACSATYHGNFEETAASADPCATLTAGALALTVPSTTLIGPLAVTIALGASPTIGPYSSETVDSWDARGAEIVTSEECLFVAGSDVTPAGSFTLAIDSLAAGGAHGTLELALTVLQTPFIDCGDVLEEHVEVQF